MAIQHAPIRSTTVGSRRGVKQWLVKGGLRNIILVVGLTFFAIWTLFPYAWILATSIKPSRDIYVSVSLIPERTTFEHYRYILEDEDFRTYFKNSLFVATATTVIATVSWTPRSAWIEATTGARRQAAA